MKIKNKIIDFLTKNKKLVILLGFLFTFIVIGVSYAYLGPLVGAPTLTNLFSSSDTVDKLVFISGDELFLNPTVENLPAGGNNLKDETITSALLVANNTTNTATDMYNMYFDVSKNNYEYTTLEKKPEIILTVYDPEGNEIIDNPNLDYVTVIDAINDVEIKGYDITAFTGLVNFASNYEISTTDSVNGTMQDWKIVVTYVNLDTNQASNIDRKLEADVILTKENLINQSNLMLDMVNNFNPNSYGWTNRNVTYTIAVTDPTSVGVHSKKYCVDDRICGPSTDLIGEEVVVDEEGESLLCVEAVDNLLDNKLQCSSKIKIDTVDPIPGDIIVDGTMGDFGWYTSPVTLTSTNGSDDLSGHDLTVLNISSINESVQSKEVVLTTIDKAGNRSTVSEIIKVDLEAPIINGVKDKTVIVDGVINLNEGISCSDDASSAGYCKVEIEQNNVNISKVGSYEVVYTATDLAGNKVSKTSTITVADDIPIIEYSVEDGIINEKGWSDSNILIDINITDLLNLGIESKKYCVAGEECVPDLTLTTDNITLSNEGDNIICVYAINTNGKDKTTCSSVYKIDKTPPIAGVVEFNGTIGNNSFYKTNVTVSSSGSSDNLSNITTNLSHTLITEDTTGLTVTLTVTDAAGNSSVATGFVKKDSTLPSVPTYVIRNDSNEILTNTTSWRNYNINISDYSAVDDTSSIFEYQYSSRCTGTSSGRLSSATSNTKHSYNSDSDWNYCIRSVDNAGNVSEWSSPFYIKIDKTAPVVGTINLSGSTGANGWYTSNVIITNSGEEDATSGILSTDLSIESITSDTKGTTILLTTTDNAGNKSTITKIVKMDKTAPASPTINMTSDGRSYTSGSWTHSDISVQLTSVDSTSGVSSFRRGSFYIEPNHSYTDDSLNSAYNYYAVDLAGNMSTKTTPTLKITRILDDYVTLFYTNKGLYYHSASLTNGAKDNNYRFSGANPNNYICFGSDAETCPAANLYRILGVYNEGGSHSVKIIKNTPALSDTYWHSRCTGSDVDCEATNVWSTAYLKTYLNTTFLNSFNSIYKNYIMPVDWHVGGNNSFNETAYELYYSEVYNPENPLIFTREIGLMYAHDYGYAAYTSAWTTDLNTYGNTNTENNNWLSGTHEWTISPYNYKESSETLYSKILQIGSDGPLSWASSFHYTPDGDIGAVGARPTMYLESSTPVCAGTGSMTDPLRIRC